MDRVNTFFLQNAMKGNLLSSTISTKDLKPQKEDSKTDSKTSWAPKGKEGESSTTTTPGKTDLKQLQSQYNLQQDKLEQSPERAIKKFFGKADELYETAQKAAPGMTKGQKPEDKKDKNIRAGGYRFNFSTKGGKLLLSKGTMQWLRNEPSKMQGFHKMLEGQFVQTQEVDIRTARQILDGVTRQLNDIAAQLAMPDAQQIMNCLSLLSDLISSFVNFDTKAKLLKKKKDKSMKGSDYENMEEQEGEQGGKFGDMTKLGQKVAWFQSLEDMVEGELDQLNYDPRAGDRRKFLRKALTIVKDIKQKLLTQSYKEFDIVE